MTAAEAPMFRVAIDSPLRKPPTGLSERQLVLVDGIRYSADMAGIAIERLWKTLCRIDQKWDAANSADIAEAALDAWSIVDAAHRLHDLIDKLPGLPNEPWRRIFRDRMQDAVALRNSWQHQVTQAAQTVERRDQAWGALAWVQHEGPKPTGRWFLAVAGSHFKGSSWMAAGPMASVPRTSTRRIRLLHAGRTFYLARAVRDIFEAIANLEEVIRQGKFRPIGEPAGSARDSDGVFFMVLEAFVSVKPKSETGVAKPNT